MPARFSIATNFDFGLLTGLARTGISEVYGSLNHLPGGSGRPSNALPEIDLSQLGEYIREAHAHGLSFNLLMNAACSGNLEFSRSGMLQYIRIIQFALDTGVDAITLASYPLLKLVKSIAPKIQLKISVHAGADSFYKVGWWLNQGADYVTLPTWCNRNFSLLNKIAKAYGSKTEMLLNNLCLPHCPLDRYHGQIVAHDSFSRVPTPDPCLVMCNLTRLENPHLFLSSPWVRPEDLHYYEAMGFERFKLTDRCKSSSWLVRVAEFYTRRQSPDNLIEIFNLPHPGEENDRVSAPSSGWRLPRIIIDNRSLSDFLLHFVNGNCSGDCPFEGCSYCRGFINKSLHYELQEFMDCIRELRSLNFTAHSDAHCLY